MKFKTNEPEICIYHSPCPDGFGAAYAVWKRWPYIQFHPATHGDPPPDVSGKHVVIVDFSYKPDVLREMAAKAKSITILDHHKTAEAGIKPLLADHTVDGLFDLTRSGAVIAWEFFHDEPVPQLLLHVQDRDLWQWKLENSREILAFIDSWEYGFEGWDYHCVSCESARGRKEMIDAGKAIERAQRNNILSLLRICTRTMTIGGLEVPVANMPYMWASDAGNILAENAAFAACYFDRADGRVFSLRSRESGADVSDIAKQYGGGGHPHASGFTMPLGWGGDHSETS